MSNDYKPVPTSSPSSSPRSSTDDQPHRPLRASIQAEFERPPPSWWKRAALVAGLMFMLWLCHRLGGMGWGEQPKVIYASRYSDEFRYRPAASPVITEHLKDGRIRLRGASVGGVGVREEDVPKREAQKAMEGKERVEEAREVAKRKLGLKTGKRKGKRAVKIASEM